MRWDPLFPFWVIAITALAAATFLVWQEWKKPHRFRILCTTSVLIMTAALLGIALKPKYGTNKSADIALLTPNYSTTRVDSLVRQNPRLVMMHLSNTPSYKNSKPLPAHLINDLDQRIRYVLGEGLPTSFLDMMDVKNFAFIPQPLHVGLTALSVSSTNVLHRNNVIVGTYNNAGGNVWLYLSGPGGKEDSVLLSKRGTYNFKLSFVPKQAGKFLFDLIVKDSVHTRREHIPIHVVEERSLNILFLHRYPTFETQFLKGFLQRKNHRLIVRYQTSKNNFRFEYVNRDPISFNRLTSELLEQTDLIISDAESISKLSSVEQTLLENELTTGLGLLHLSGDGKTNRSSLYPFKNIPTKNDTVHVQIAGKFHSFPIAYSIEENSALTSLEKNKKGALSGYNFHGAGKIGFQTLQETFKLSLSGDSVGYSMLWTPLIEQVAKPPFKTSKIDITTPFPLYEDEPIDIEVISSNENISLMADRVPLPLKEHLRIDNMWRARTWGGVPGWHTLTTGNDSLHYYVSDSDEWNSVALMNQRRANEMVEGGLVSEATTVEAWEEVPQWIFYLIFLFSVGFIWVAPKL